MTITIEVGDEAQLHDAVGAHLSGLGGTRIIIAEDIILTEPVVIAPAQDMDARLHITGLGRRGRKISQSDPAKNIFELTNTTMNLRGIVIDDLWFVGGKSAIHTIRTAYLLFRNLAFMQQEEWAVRSGIGSYRSEFVSCWWVHQHGDALFAEGSGVSRLMGGIIGEDAGGIRVTGTLVCVGTDIFDSWDKLTPEGHLSMGRATFTVTGSGKLRGHGGDVQAPGHLFNVDNHRSVTWTGGDLNATGDILRVRRNGGHNRITGADVTFSGKLASSAIGRVITNTVIANNMVNVPAGADLTANLADPSNVVTPNLVVVRP